MKTYWGSGVTAPRINLGTRWRWEFNFMLRPPHPPHVPAGYVDGWAPKPVWKRYRGEKKSRHCPCKDSKFPKIREAEPRRPMDHRLRTAGTCRAVRTRLVLVIPEVPPQAAARFGHYLLAANDNHNATCQWFTWCRFKIHHCVGHWYLTLSLLSNHIFNIYGEIYRREWSKLPTIKKCEHPIT